MRRATTAVAAAASSSSRLVGAAAVRTASSSSSSPPPIAGRPRRAASLPFRPDGVVVAPAASPRSATFSSASSGGGGAVGGGGGESAPAGDRPMTSKSDRDGRDRRSFGPLGHDYTLYPNAGPKTSVLPDDAINDLLARRLDAKLARRFRFADVLQNELRWFGVDVDDARRIWRADGSTFGEDEGGSRSRGGQIVGPKAADDGSRVRGVDGSRHGGVDGSDQYGPLGHDYRPSPSAGPKTSVLPDDRIHDLLSRRLAARLTGKFSVADVLQNELRWFGVDVDDARRVWRADGMRFGEERGAAIENDGRAGGEAGPHLGHDYELYQHAGPKTSVLSYDRINSLLSRRLEARRTGNYDAADELRRELRWYGVDVDDKRKVWRADGFRFGEDDRYWRELPRKGDDSGGREDGSDNISSS